MDTITINFLQQLGYTKVTSSCGGFLQGFFVWFVVFFPMYDIMIFLKMALPS